MSSVLDKIKKTSKIKYADVLSNSVFFSEKEMISTDIPILNLAASGLIDGGFASGHTAIAGPSKHFKTSFALVMASAYLKKYEDAALLFYDSEFGSPQSYFKQFGINTSRVLHTPISTIEELKTDIVNQLTNIERGDHLIIIIDSISNIASSKEVDDAIQGKFVVDMIRAKSLKSLFRMVTSILSIKNIPLITINHTYDTMEMYSKQVVSGGKGIVYSSDNIWIIGRRQEKEGTETVGYNFIINVEKSRFVKEGSKFPISVSWEDGISKWSGMIDLASEGGFVIKKNRGRLGNAYCIQGEEDIFFDKEEVNSDNFWNLVFEKTNFRNWLNEHFKL